MKSPEIGVAKVFDVYLSNTIFEDHNEVADLLRNAKTVADDRSECTALYEAVAKGKTSKKFGRNIVSF